MVRAYKINYKRSYSVHRQWNEYRGRYYQGAPHARYRCTSYELEQNRILELIRHLRDYKVPKSTPLPGYTRDMMAIAGALKGYYRRFKNYDCHLMFELDGISFREYKLANYGTVRQKRTNYTQLFAIHRLLHEAGWDIEGALHLWLEESRRQKDVLTLSTEASAYNGRAKEPTLAMILGMYGRIVRHKAVKDLVGCYSVEALSESEDDTEMVADWWESEAVSVCKYYHDVSSRLETIKKEVSKRASRHTA